MNIVVQNKQLWMSNSIVVASLVLVAFFPIDDGFQSMIASVAFLVVLPVLFIHVFLKEKTAAFGVSWGKVTQGVVWLTLFLLIVVGMFVVAYKYTNAFLQTTIPFSVQSSFSSFLIYITILGILIASQEFFFRGFVLNIWKKTLGYRAIFVQAAFSLVLSMIRSHGHIEFRTLVIAAFSLCAGWIAYRSQSIWYSFFFFFISAILGVAMVLVFVR